MDNKFKSRKFWAMIITTIAGIGTALSHMNDLHYIIIGAILIAASSITYMVVEGNVDAKNVAQIVIDAASLITQEEEEKDVSEDIQS